MKIVILDGYVANGGDLSWQALDALGELTVYERTAPSEVIKRAQGADAIFTNKVLITKEIIDALPSLKFIGVLATGYNNVDIDAATAAGITVCNVPAYSTHSVVQTIFALLLDITNQVRIHADACRAGEWTKCADFSFRLGQITEINGLTMGIYGIGNIGSEVAKVANAFGMNVIALTSKKPWQLPGYIKPVDREEFFSHSDVVVLCSPLTPENYHFINAETLSMMKNSAIIINTARGGMVDSVALANALRSGKIAAAGVDVLENEPPRADEPLLSAPNCLVTPHYAWAGRQARERLIQISAENLKAFIAGNPQNIVN